MIIFLLNVYIGILALFLWFRVIPFNLFWKLSPVVVLLVLLVGLFIPMGWGAPSGSGVVIRNSVQIVPEVTGEVIDVPIDANVPLKSRRSLSLPSCVFPSFLSCKSEGPDAPSMSSSGRRRSTGCERNWMARAGTWTKRQCGRRQMATSPISHCARARELRRNRP
jgi:hypothetical protein